MGSCLLGNDVSIIECSAQEKPVIHLEWTSQPPATFSRNRHIRNAKKISERIFQSCDNGKTFLLKKTHNRNAPLESSSSSFDCQHAATMCKELKTKGQSSQLAIKEALVVCCSNEIT